MADPLHWLSFADARLPEGEQFLGVVIVQAPDFISAVMASRTMGLNPGGEVAGVEFPPGFEVAEKWRDRLLTREECEAFDAEAGA